MKSFIFISGLTISTLTLSPQYVVAQSFWISGSICCDDKIPNNDYGSCWDATPVPGAELMAWTVDGDTLNAATDKTGGYEIGPFSAGTDLCVVPKETQQNGLLGEIGNLLTSYDAALVYEYLSNSIHFDEVQFLVADVSGDSVVEMGDAESIQSYRVNDMIEDTKYDPDKAGHWIFRYMGAINWSYGFDRCCYQSIWADFVEEGYCCLFGGEVSMDWYRAIKYNYVPPLNRVTLGCQFSPPSIDENKSDHFRVPIILKSGFSNLHSYDLSIAYDSKKLEVEGLDFMGSHLSGWGHMKHGSNDELGILGVSHASGNPIDLQNGDVLLDLLLSLKEQFECDDSAVVYVREMMFNENRVIFSQGSIDTIYIHLPDITPYVSDSDSAANINFSDADPAGNITVTATVRNREDMQVDSVGIQAFDGDPGSGGTQIQDTLIMSISGNDSAKVDFQWNPGNTPLHGAKGIWILVDPYDKIQESDEENNKAVCIRTPVILVHGWRPLLDENKDCVAVWDSLKPRVQKEGIMCYELTYSLTATGDPKVYADSLERFISDIRKQTGYEGKFDIVCHSMGALVSRWYMEEKDGSKDIRQWIGLAPANHGAAIADWNIAGFLPLIRHIIPPWILWEEAVVQLSTNSPRVRDLDENWARAANGVLDSVTYRVIVGVNCQKSDTTDMGHKYKWFGGKTRVRHKCLPTGKGNVCTYFFVYLGDGIVATEQSRLEGAGLDCIEGASHTSLCLDPRATGKVIGYLKDPSQPLLQDFANQWWCSTETNPCEARECFYLGERNEGNVNKNGRNFLQLENKTKFMQFKIDRTTTQAMVELIWAGSDLKLTLMTPSGSELQKGVYPVLEYWKGDTQIEYVFDIQESGDWTAVVEAVDVPPEGEEFCLLTFLSSPMCLALATAEDTTEYGVGGYVTLIATITNGDIPVIGASVSIRVTRPDGSTLDLSAYDNGTHGDQKVDDGDYTSVYGFQMAGTYHFVATSEGMEFGGYRRMDFVNLWATGPSPEPQDFDGDGVWDIWDNCLTDYNPDQEDDDKDGRGSICDLCPYDPENDIDKDGQCADTDNCPCVYNPGQEDSNGDGLGDVCQSLRGDVDGSCSINVLDVLRVVNIILELRIPTDYEKAAGDCSGDDTINIVDAIGIVNEVLDVGECAP